MFGPAANICRQLILPSNGRAEGSREALAEAPIINLDENIVLNQSKLGMLKFCI